MEPNQDPVRSDTPNVCPTLFVQDTLANFSFLQFTHSNSCLIRPFFVRSFRAFHNSSLEEGRGEIKEEEVVVEEREVRGLTPSTSPAETKKKGECGARGITPLSNRSLID